ncbi:hypothetical protein GO003_018460 [Methylicorpusculum oleiharenae]|nr:hypothetical protein [Methylicorpusculum oleiharenae]MCD2452374.1 hypothetical protein [Methylicorpusculum oleiharenae]
MATIAGQMQQLPYPVWTPAVQQTGNLAFQVRVAIGFEKQVEHNAR